MTQIKGTVAAKTWGSSSSDAEIWDPSVQCTPAHSEHHFPTGSEVLLVVEYI